MRKQPDNGHTQAPSEMEGRGGALPTNHALKPGGTRTVGREELALDPVRFPRGRVQTGHSTGLIEVRFKNDIFPVVTNESGQPRVDSARADRAALQRFNEVIASYGALSAEPSLDLDYSEAESAWKLVQQHELKTPHLLSFVTFHFPKSADLKEIAASLRDTPSVANARPVPLAVPPADPEPYQGTGDTIPDPFTHRESQWYLSRCEFPDAWQLATGKDVVVAAIDWGFRTKHQDLKRNVEQTYNVKTGSKQVNKGTNVYHGTAVLGHAGAARNDRGVLGCAFESKLWAIQAQQSKDEEVVGSPWARGIDWVRRKNQRTDHRPRVIILEVQTADGGNYEEVESVRAVIETAIAAGIVVCVPAGNAGRDASVADDGTDIPETGSILVGATLYDDDENPCAPTSNFGARVTVWAPGDPDHDLCCHDLANDAYKDRFGGTSGAAPKVAGVAALLLSVSPTLSHEQVRRLIVECGLPLHAGGPRPIGVFLQAAPAVEAARRAGRAS